MLSLKKKGLVASVAAVAMAVGGLGLGAGTAFADDSQQIKVSGFEDGYTYSVFELGKYLGTCPTDPKAEAKVAVQAKDEAASKAVQNAATASGVDLKGATDAVAGAAQLNSYGSDIRKIASALKASDLDTPVTGASIDKTTTEITVPEAGWYVITAENAKSGKSAVASLAGTACGSIADGTVVLKNPNGNLPGDNTDQDPSKKMTGSLKQGNTVEFTLSAALPDYSGMKDLEYAFYDYPAAGLTPDASSLKVTVGKDTLATADYAVRSGASLTKADTNFDPDASQKGQDFVVDLSTYLKGKTADELKALKGQKVTVTYTASVDDMTKIDPKTINSFDVDNNGVKVPEGPHDGNPNHPGNDTPNPSTSKVSFEKVDETGTTALDGAEFTLTSDTNPAIKSVAVSGDTDGDGTVSADEASAKTGLVEFTNLGEGDYTITETKAPTGYMKSGSTFKVKVTAAEDESTSASLTEGDDATNVINGATGTASGKDVTFENVKNLTQLPLTGAYGIALFLILAVILAGGSAAMITVSKRNKKNALAL
ncbi:MAG: isopeptide-forming domain-containing fimbrial protein [Bifidobacteriaceae bacterium]|jgi:fimbrial isopeptide formation D2 family protein|nr:isopeptide-forming domain-containing fimbrial protein [Bifidobacteriaceae bacterium]